MSNQGTKAGNPQKNRGRRKPKKENEGGKKSLWKAWGDILPKKGSRMARERE